MTITPSLSAHGDPFEIWPIAVLNDLVYINPESRDPTLDPQDKFSYIDIDSVENGTGLIKGVKIILGKDAPSRARRIVRADDVIMSEVRPYLKAFAIVPKKLDNQICSTGFAVLRSKGDIEPEFLLNVLFSNEVIEQCNRMMVGAQYPALNDSQVKKIHIPLPPLPEQRQIATILSTVDNALQRSQQAITETERLKVGVMQELMTKGIGHTKFKEDPDVGRVPKEWNVNSLEHISERITVGIVVKPADHYVAQGIPAFRSFNILSDKLNTNDLVFISKIENDSIFLKSKIFYGDILVVRTGTPGTACVVPKEFDGCNCIDLIIISPKKIAVIAEYLSRYINSQIVKSQIFNLKSGLAQQHINVNEIKKVKVSIPPLTEQQQIIAILTKIDSKLLLQRQRTSHYERLKQGLMNDLLTGKRRVTVT
ncbi:restriction endonuclease subunit S [Methanoregula sp.]|uniref:restriction endonuclease subunit S n=1 Tax=Methanoregula sp. TaxID=2052170 RepID=UPI00356209FE